MKHLKKAQSSNIKQIRFVRQIGRLDIHDNSRGYDIEDDCHIFEIFLENDITVVGRLDIVPYIRTFVQYNGTFGASDQGQMLDV